MPSLHGDAEADVLVMVVGGAAAGADDEASVAEVVQQGSLHGQAHRVVEGQLDHGESYLDVLGAGGDGCAVDQGVGVGRRAIEVVLGEPDGVHTDFLGQQDFLEGAVDYGGVAVCLVADGEDEGTEAHNCLAPDAGTGLCCWSERR